MSLLDLFRKARHPAASTSSAPPPEPMELFTREVEAALREHDQVTGFERIPGDAALLVRRGEVESTLYLQNIFDETRELPPEERAERARSFVASLLDSEDEERSDWDGIRPNLMLAVRASTYGVGSLPSGGLIPPRAARAFAPFLDATLVIDRPRSMDYVSRTQLEGWPVEESEAFDAALGNVAENATTGMEKYSDTHGPVWHLPGDDPYAASRLLLPGWLAAMRDRVEGQPLAIIPERTTLIVGGDARPELVKWLADTARREFASGARAISPAVYTIDATTGAVVPYWPGRGADASNPVRMGHAMLRAQTYKEQKEALDAYHERIGLDLFVASATLVQLEDGRPYDYCVWVEGVDGLLPVTDVVVATGGDKEEGTSWTACVPLQTAREIGGSLWTKADVPFGPERYRVSGAFTPEQKAALLAASRPTSELA